jgi:hypothetical protein
MSRRSKTCIPGRILEKAFRIGALASIESAGTQALRIWNGEQGSSNGTATRSQDIEALKAGG